MDADLTLRQRKSLDSLFWDAEIRSMFAALYPLILNAALDAAKQAMSGAAGIGVDWALVNTAAVKWAKTYTYDLVKGINEVTRYYLQDQIPAWIESGAPLDALIDNIAPMFGPVRAEMIGVTEVTRAFAEGNLIAWKEAGYVSGQRWMTAEDDLVCPLCSPRDGEVYPLGDSENTPPGHVRCRCYLQPVLESSS